MTTEPPSKNAVKDWCGVLSRKGLDASTKLLLESLHNSSDPLHQAFVRTYGKKLQAIVGDADAPVSRDEQLYLLVEQARPRHVYVNAAISEVADYVGLKLDTVRQARQRVLRAKTTRPLSDDELRALTPEERDGLYEHMAEENDLHLKGRPSGEMENVRRYILIGGKPYVVVRKPASQSGDG